MAMRTITSEELAKKLEKARNAADEYCELFNSPDRVPSKKLQASKKKANDEAKEYNQLLSYRKYQSWSTSGDPVRLALEMYNIKGSKKFSFKENEAGMMMVSEVEDKTCIIDLVDMFRCLGSSVFVDPTWIEDCADIVSLVATIVAVDMGQKLPIVDSELIRKKFNISEDNVFGKEAAVEVLNNLIAKILPGITAGLDAWTLIRESMTGHGSAKGSVAVCSTSRFVKLVAEAISTKLDEVHYTVEFTLVGKDKLISVDADAEAVEESTEAE